MKKLTAVLLFFLLVATLVVLDAGRFVDVTQTPRKSDIIVCLGGGTTARVDKSMQLLAAGYASRKTVLVMGESWYNHPYIQKYYSDVNIVIDEHPKDTVQELLAVKKYMLENALDSAVIVTDPPHSGRVRLLLSLLEDESDRGLRFTVVGSNVAWWDKAHYYRNAKARKVVLHELGGIAYALYRQSIAGRLQGY